MFFVANIPVCLVHVLLLFLLVVYMLQITKCIGSTSYSINGLQPFTSYSVSVTVCTIAREGPMETLPIAMTRTSAGTPTLVDSITATGSTSNSIAFSWNPVQFNDVGGRYEVSCTFYTILYC